ncbi:MAG: hypothetical protein ACRDZO_06010 [Egibacteraceae bacterium]
MDHQPFQLATQMLGPLPIINAFCDRLSLGPAAGRLPAPRRSPHQARPGHHGRVAGGNLV